MADQSIVKIKKVCSEYLGEKWSKGEIEATRLTTGLGNESYRCSLKDKSDTSFLVKFYGSQFTGNSTQFKYNCEAAEALIFYKMSQIGFAPKLVAVFSGGRIEEFVEGSNPTLEQQTDRSFLAAVAKKLAKFHSLSMPIIKRIQFPGTLKTHALGMKLQRNLEELSKTEREFVENIFNFPLIDEFNWYEKYAPIFGARIVLSHDDFNPANMMLRNEGLTFDDRLLFIDYETTSYNYRGFDLGTFFVSLRLRRGASSFGESYFIDYGHDENFEIENFFIEHYLSKVKASGTFDKTKDTVDYLLMESTFFQLQAFLGLVSVGLMWINKKTEGITSYSFLNDSVVKYYQLKNIVLRDYSHMFEKI